MGPQLCFIKEAYFKDRGSFEKMLDAGDPGKQSHRTHLCLEIELNKNRFYVPLRNNLGPEIRKYGRIGHAVPSASRKNAGLDYRYTLIVNDAKYIEAHKERRIPESQYRCIKKDYDDIKTEFSIYLKGFLRAVRKRRIEKEPLYRESSLVNFLAELE